MELKVYYSRILFRFQFHYQKTNLSRNNNINSHMQKHCWTDGATPCLYFKRNEKKINIFLRAIHRRSRTAWGSMRINFYPQHKSARESWLIESKVEILFLYLAKWNFHFFCGISTSTLLLRETRVKVVLWLLDVNELS
jgi:hypothetical protein